MFLFFKLTAPIVLSVLFFFSPALAIDYSILSNDELYELQGAIKNAPETEQEAYSKEWQQRLNEMSEDDVKRYTLGVEESDNDNSLGSEGNKAPIIHGRGYDKQGTGTVIFGGMPSGK